MMETIILTQGFGCAVPECLALATVEVASQDAHVAFHKLLPQGWVVTQILSDEAFTVYCPRHAVEGLRA